MHVLDHRREIQEPEQQWRRDIVGQVADHPQGHAVPCQGGEIESERIRTVQLEAGIDAEGGEQAGDQVPVQFHHVEANLPADQRRRQRSLSGPDFHQMLPGLRVDGVGDTGDHSRVLEEVLAEALARRVGSGRHARQCTLLRAPTQLLWLKIPGTGKLAGWFLGHRSCTGI